MVNLPITLEFATLIISVALTGWSIAKYIGRIEHQVELLRNDVNAMGKGLREDLHYHDQKFKQLRGVLLKLENFLSENCKYQPSPISEIELYKGDS